MARRWAASSSSTPPSTRATLAAPCSTGRARSWASSPPSPIPRSSPSSWASASPSPSPPPAGPPALPNSDRPQGTSMSLPPPRISPMEQVVFQVKKLLVGQDVLLERLIVALLARGHVLVEGVPGLAKTMAIKTLAQTIGGQFQRIQFTPDLVPADLIGTRIYNQRLGEFQTSLGPVHTNLLLADEINRAPAKVQSALLEVMQERQVTIGRESF